MKITQFTQSVLASIHQFMHDTVHSNDDLTFTQWNDMFTEWYQENTARDVKDLTPHTGLTDQNIDRMPVTLPVYPPVTRFHFMISMEDMILLNKDLKSWTWKCEQDGTGYHNVDEGWIGEEYRIPQTHFGDQDERTRPRLFTVAIGSQYLSDHNFLKAICRRYCKPKS